MNIDQLLKTNQDSNADDDEIESSDDENVLDLSNHYSPIIGEDCPLDAGLVELDLTANRIEKIQNIGHLINLQKICFRQNLIDKIENLETLTSLRELDLYDNKLKKIQNLTLPSLTYLDLSFNVIKKLKMLPQIIYHY